MATTFTKEIKPSADSYLLKEDSYYLLLETGNKIVLSRGIAFSKESKPTISFTKETKPTISFTKETKP